MRASYILKNQYFWLGLIIIIAFFIRLYKIDAPIADWHSWRQADTAAVTRNFIKEGFNPFIPRFDDMSGIAENPIANTLSFRFVEFPIYNIAVYPFYLFFGVDEKLHRLVSVFFALGGIVFLYLICKKYLGIKTGLFISLVYSLLPFNIFFSRTTLPEPTFLFFSLGMMYFLDEWVNQRKGIWAFIFTAIAFLIKPWAIFFFLPIIYSVYSRRNNRKYWGQFMLFTFIAVLPFIIWRFWILQQPEGIPASSWLMNGDGIRFRPAFFWWIISERLGREILGASGFVLFIIGLILKPKNKNYFLHVWALSLFLYFIIFATGNVRHNYYQYIFTPVAAVFLSLGFLRLLAGIENFLPRFWTIILALLFLPLSFYFSWTQVKGFYQINNPVIIEAGKKADQTLPKDAIVLAPYNGDTAFLYQTNRRGWPFMPYPIKDMIADYGVTSYISTALDKETSWIIRHFNVLEQNDKYIIVDLTKSKKNFNEKQDPEPR